MTYPYIVLVAVVYGVLVVLAFALMSITYIADNNGLDRRLLVVLFRTTWPYKIVGCLLPLVSPPVVLLGLIVLGMYHACVLCSKLRVRITRLPPNR